MYCTVLGHTLYCSAIYCVLYALYCPGICLVLFWIHNGLYTLYCTGIYHVLCTALGYTMYSALHCRVLGYTSELKYVMLVE